MCEIADDENTDRAAIDAPKDFVETWSCRGQGSGDASIAVDDVDLLVGPAPALRDFSKAYLVRVLRGDLDLSGLPDVDDCVLLEMLGADLLGGARHSRPPYAGKRTGEPPKRRGSPSSRGSPPRSPRASLGELQDSHLTSLGSAFRPPVGIRRDCVVAGLGYPTLVR